jgi:hypothetical protein
MKEWKHRCLRSVMTYRPDPLRPDRVTIGFVLFDTAAGSPHREVRFAPDLRTLKCIAPDLEIEMVEAMLAEVEPEIRSVITNITDAQKFPAWFPEGIPDEIEFLPPNPILTEDFDEEVITQSNQLFRALYEQDLDVQQRNRHQYGRLYLQREIRHWYEEFGVWPYLEKRIAVDSFMLKGDTYNLECGYLDETANTFRMLDAVSLITSLDRARILALSWPRVRKGMTEKKGVTDCELVAIVEAGITREAGKAKDAWQWMEDAGIRVAPVSAMPVLAAEARGAMRL